MKRVSDVAFYLLPLLLVLGEFTFAANTGTIAQNTGQFWTEAKNFLQGPGGALLALAGVGWGVYSFIRGSIFMGTAGVLGGIGLYKVPDVINSVFTMTI